MDMAKDRSNDRASDGVGAGATGVPTGRRRTGTVPPLQM
jgi:hypothetical protein